MFAIPIGGDKKVQQHCHRVELQVHGAPIHQHHHLLCREKVIMEVPERRGND